MRKIYAEGLESTPGGLGYPRVWRGIPSAPAAGKRRTWVEYPAHRTSDAATCRPRRVPRPDVCTRQIPGVVPFWPLPDVCAHQTRSEYLLTDQTWYPKTQILFRPMCIFFDYPLLVPLWIREYPLVMPKVLAGSGGCSPRVQSPSSPAFSQSDSESTHAPDRMRVLAAGPESTRSGNGAGPGETSHDSVA